MLAVMRMRLLLMLFQVMCSLVHVATAADADGAVTVDGL